MLFNSIQFLIFLPVVCLIYFIIPKKVRYIWLLVSSYYFYMCWNAEYAILIFISTLITYLSGLLLEKIKKNDSIDIDKSRLKKCVVALSFILNLGILAYFKYAGFAVDIAESIGNLVGVELNIPAFDIILPVGISFYTFQALSYTMDVYRGEIYAEKNFLRYALFVSFFPQLVAGPIERSKNLLKQLSVPSDFSFKRTREGVIVMLWGYFLKVVVADRIAVFVDSVYGNYGKFGGMYLVVATVLFAFQIYCDFYGYSVIAKGTAHIFGIELMENFNAPYLSTSVSQFWRKWHISLTSWFKDYLYIPLGGSRKGTIRKYINKMIVFLVSGLWHGAEMSFVIWGGLNGLYQVIGEVTSPFKEMCRTKLHINENALAVKIIKGMVTFVLIDFSWIFFRASTVADAFNIIKSIFTMDNAGILFNGGLFDCGLDIYNFILMILCLLVLLTADIFKTKGVKLSGVIAERNFAVRTAVMIVAAIFIIVFGIYGLAYNQTSFIYFQF
ncbi:MAG: MBOAT family O-acyltransferase [Lachnospira sp.]